MLAGQYKTKINSAKKIIAIAIMKSHSFDIKYETIMII